MTSASSTTNSSANHVEVSTLKVQSKRLHLAYIDGIRAVAALYVVCVHTLPRAWGTGTPRWLILRLLAKCLVQGHFAVTAFIVISGYCLMLPVSRDGMVLRGGSVVFFKRRFWRIAPPMYAAVILSIVVYQDGTTREGIESLHVTLRQVLAHALLIQDAVPGALLANNGPLWSVSAECFMYLFFPPMVWFSRKNPALMSLSCFALGCVMVRTLGSTPLGAIPWQYLGAFAIGALAAEVSFGSWGLQPSSWWWRQLRYLPSNKWYTIAIISFGIVLIACIAIGWRHVENFIPLLDLPISISAAALLIGASCAAPHDLIRRFFSMRWLAAIGMFSYSLYMTHFPLSNLIEAYILHPLKLGELECEAALLFAVIPLLLASAYVFYFFCERPFHAISQNIGKQSAA